MTSDQIAEWAAYIADVLLDPVVRITSMRFLMDVQGRKPALVRWITDALKALSEGRVDETAPYYPAPHSCPPPLGNPTREEAIAECERLRGLVKEAAHALSEAAAAFARRGIARCAHADGGQSEQPQRQSDGPLLTESMYRQATYDQAMQRHRKAVHGGGECDCPPSCCPHHWLVHLPAGGQHYGRVIVNACCMACPVEGDHHLHDFRPFDPVAWELEEERREQDWLGKGADD